MTAAIDETNFICLATIEKSGTHWVRHFLANYFLRYTGNDPGRTLFSHATIAVYPNERGGYIVNGVPLRTTGPLPPPFRDLVYQHGFNNLANFPGWIIALYRNPLDSVVSSYHYFHLSRRDEKAHVGSIGEVAERYALRWARDYVGLQRVRERAAAFRYEQIVDNPEGVFRQILNFLGAPIDETLMRQVIKDIEPERFRTAAQVENLNPNFIVPIARSGAVGQWRTEISEADIQIIRAALRVRKLDLDAVLAAEWPDQTIVST